MNGITDKSKMIYVVLEQLQAIDRNNKVNVYTIFDYIIEEGEILYKHELLKDIPEDNFVNMTLDISVKGISTCLTSLVKKNYVIKTEPSTITVDGTSRKLCEYYLKK